MVPDWHVSQISLYKFELSVQQAVTTFSNKVMKKHFYGHEERQTGAWPKQNMLLGMFAIPEKENLHSSVGPDTTVKWE